MRENKMMERGKGKCLELRRMRVHYIYNLSDVHLKDATQFLGFTPI